MKRIVGTPFIDECRLIIAGLGSAQISHCQREANKAAELPAKSIDDQESSFWIDDPPFFLIFIAYE
jgi:hypothetical protein